jgi:hypothetical protein
MTATRLFPLGFLAQILVAAMGTACSPESEVDLGELVVSTAEAGRPLFWSKDDTTLYWYGWTARGRGLQAVEVETRANHQVIEGHDDADSPRLVAEDTVLFFLADRPDQYSGGTLYQAPFADGRAAVPVPLATHVSAYAVSLDGTRIATIEDKTGLLTALDILSGALQSFGRCSLGGFSPDGSRLLAETAPASGAATRFLADPITGAMEPTDIVGDVIAWDGGTPRRVVRNNLVIDLLTGVQQAFENPYGWMSFYSGDSANLDTGYYDAVECLKWGTAQDGTRDCETAQGSLYRVNLNSGQRDAVAKYPSGGSISFAVSQDGRKLASAMATDVAADPSIYVKTLSPGP